MLHELCTQRADRQVSRQAGKFHRGDGHWQYAHLLNPKELCEAICIDAVLFGSQDDRAERSRR
jgi:hypothetical protein